MRKNFEHELLSQSGHLKDLNHLPEDGLNKKEILELVKTYLGLGEYDWRKGTQSGTVYNGWFGSLDSLTKLNPRGKNHF